MRGYSRAVDQRRLNLTNNPPRPTWVGDTWYRKLLRQEKRQQAAATSRKTQKQKNTDGNKATTKQKKQKEVQKDTKGKGRA